MAVKWVFPTGEREFKKQGEKQRSRKAYWGKYKIRKAIQDGDWNNNFNHIVFVLYIHEMGVLRREEDFLFGEEIHGAYKNLTIDSIYSFYVLRPLKFKLI